MFLTLVLSLNILGKLVGWLDLVLLPEIRVWLNSSPKIAELIFLAAERKLTRSLSLGLILLQAIDRKVCGIFYWNYCLATENGIDTCGVVSIFTIAKCPVVRIICLPRTGTKQHI